MKNKLSRSSVKLQKLWQLGQSHKWKKRWKAEPDYICGVDYMIKEVFQIQKACSMLRIDAEFENKRNKVLWVIPNKLFGQPNKSSTLSHK